MTRVLYIGDPSSVHDIKWVSFFSTRPEFEAYFLVQKHEMNLVTPERRKLFDELGITVVGPIHSYSLWRFWENRASLQKINSIIKEHKIDLVHTLFATPFALWTDGLKIPSIITTRGSDVHVVLSGLGKGSILHRIHGSILLNKFKSAFINAAAITCTSEGQLKKVNQIFGTQLSGEVIRTGVNVDEINQLKPQLSWPENIQSKRVIFLPRYMRPIYQTELAIDALQNLDSQIKSQLAVVLIKGSKTEPEYESLVNQKLSSLGIEYHIYDSLTQHEMWSAFKQTALSIMTPKTDGTPNSALEAMAARCPLILGSFKYDEDLFSEKFCHRLSSDSVEELTRMIQDTLDSYPTEKLEAAFENVSKYGNRMVEMGRIEKLYLSLTQG